MQKPEENIETKNTQRDQKDATEKTKLLGHNEETSLHTKTEEENPVIVRNELKIFLRSAWERAKYFARKKYVVLCVVCVVGFWYLASNLLTNVGVQEMGYYMPIYSSFLLYGTTFMYTLLFFISAIFARERFSLTKQGWVFVIILGLCTAGNGIFAQIAIPFVDPEITAIITQISAPITWVFSVVMMKRDLYFTHLLAFFLIMFALLFGTVYSYYHGSGSQTKFDNSFVWIAITVASAIPTAFETLFQEMAFRRKVPKFVALTYYNAISLIFYLAWTPMTMVGKFGTCVGPDTVCFDESVALKLYPCSFEQMFVHQLNSVKCFFGVKDVPCCKEGAWVKVLEFTFGYFASFSLGAVLLANKKIGANVVSNLNALTYPLAAIVFMIPFLVGQFRSQFEWWILFSLVIVGAGFLLFANQGMVLKYACDLRIIPFHRRKKLRVTEKMITSFEERMEKCGETATVLTVKEFVEVWNNIDVDHHYAEIDFKVMVKKVFKEVNGNNDSESVMEIDTFMQEVRDKTYRV